MLKRTVSVIIATYNYSAALRCAMASALAQTFPDFELLVIGDGCNDDSAEVAASFQDPRVRWHNLPENSGYQAAPNNTGLKMAQGRYAAYLGHDDLWFPDHLARLVEKIEETGADLVFSLAALIAPDSPIRVLTGATPSGRYEPGVAIVPSSLLHRIEVAREIGAWRDYREVHTPADQVFVGNAWSAGKRFESVRELTVLKFPAAWRKDIYRDRSAREQEHYLAQLHDPDLRIRELTATALAYAEGNVRAPVDFAAAPAGADAGWTVDQWREWKGLPRAAGSRASAPLYTEPAALRILNQRADIVPEESLGALFSPGELPENGIFLGRGWYELEHDGGDRFRWLATAGELVITRALKSQIVIEAESGPGMRCQPFELTLADLQGARISSATVSYRREIFFDLPAGAGYGAVFRLMAPSGGVQTGADPRMLNLRVFSIRWK